MADSTTFTLKSSLQLLAKAVDNLEPRFTTRALRTVPALRKQFALPEGDKTLAELIRDKEIFGQDAPQQKLLLDYLGNPSAPTVAPTPEEEQPATMEVDSTPSTTESKATSATAAAGKKEKPPAAPLATLPEAQTFLTLLVILRLLDAGNASASRTLAEKTLGQTKEWNRRTMDGVAAKVWFYWVRSVEVAGGDTASLRSDLLAAQRTSALHRDDELQATLLPLLLRNYLQHQLYDQADRLVSKTTFPSGTAKNAEMARWFYYVGRIRAIQLNYSEAHTNLQQAIRRAPNASSAPGFLQTAHKLSIIVELLMGEIPERSIFRQPVLKKALSPYLEIVQAVRIGDIQKFNSTLTLHSSTFTADLNSSLILRLRHNVIKTALRTISLSYSRIPLGDIRDKLALKSEEDAEYVVAKAIRDGVIEAQLEREGQGVSMRSRERGDVYSTGEVQGQFDQRIRFLLELHKTSVKAMRYPLNAHSKELASAGEARERERELAKEIEDADEDADLDGPGDIDGF